MLYMLLNTHLLQAWVPCSIADATMPVTHRMRGSKGQGGHLS
jgi:hypothetical protein